MCYIRNTRASTFARCTAKSVDFCVVALLCVLIPYPAGPLAGLAYALLHDALNGQGLGKRIFGLRTVRANSSSACRIVDSVLRNLPFALVVLFSLIPLWGWLSAICFGPSIALIEVYYMSAQSRARRLGDALARTKVVVAHSSDSGH